MAPTTPRPTPPLASRDATEPQPPHTSGPRVAIIGAGCSGLVSLKSCLEVRLNATCFEMGRDVGGLWTFGNSNGRGGAYRSLHINTSTRQMEFSDFPMRKDIGDYPHHSHIKEYFQAYADHFRLLPHIRFASRVDACTPCAAGGYALRISDESGTHEEFFDAVIVANGHHFEPSVPPAALTRDFSGQVLHAHHYVDPTSPIDCVGKRVLVVGMGNSAMDIACELTGKSSVAEEARASGALAAQPEASAAEAAARGALLPHGSATAVHVSARRGVWVVPKYLLGKPVDQGTIIPMWLPGKLRRHIVTRSFQWLYGKMSSFGLPEPDHLIGEAHPTLSSDFAPLVRQGAISMHPAIAACHDKLVRFSDGSEVEVDVIIFATGYRISFPFFEQEHIAAPNNEVPLYLRIFHPEHSHVFFVGLLQTLGAVMPSAERQARLIAEHLLGNYNLPDSESMYGQIERYTKAMKKRFVASARHTMQVIPEDYQRELEKELRLGKVRARKGQGRAFSAAPSCPAPQAE